MSKVGRQKPKAPHVTVVRDSGRPLPAMFTDTTVVDTSVDSPEECDTREDANAIWERFPELRTRVVPKMPTGVHIDGTMFVRVYVDKHGIVRRASIMQGWADPAVNRAVLRAVLQYTFAPARLNNAPMGACKWIAVHEEEPTGKKRQMLPDTISARHL